MNLRNEEKLEKLRDAYYDPKVGLVSVIGCIENYDPQALCVAKSKHL